MKKALFILILLPLLLLPLSGCVTATSTTPAAALAPGYLNSADQTLGESLAAVNAFVNQEKINYTAQTSAQQATEKPYLNGLITATNLANASYQAYHAGSQTLAQAQTALASAQQAQATLTTTQGVK
jgi:hypothetical protein